MARVMAAMNGGAKNRAQGDSRVPKHKSQSVPESADARAVRTRGRLDAAFVTLLHGRAYESIRVSDVTRKAQVGRATFYAHFESKDALLRSQFNRIVAPMIRLQAGAPCPFDCTALFRHILTARRLYRSLARSRVIRGCFEERLLALLGQIDLRSTLKQPELAFLLAASLTTFLEWRLAHEAGETAETLQSAWAGVAGGTLAGTRG